MKSRLGKMETMSIQSDVDPRCPGVVMPLRANVKFDRWWFFRRGRGQGRDGGKSADGYCASYSPYRGMKIESSSSEHLELIGLAGGAAAPDAHLSTTLRRYAFTCTGWWALRCNTKPRLLGKSLPHSEQSTPLVTGNHLHFWTCTDAPRGDPVHRDLRR
ncbi:hypothetical protein J6590_066355 [Homalodisca vitripennis]|nr:hypothetical protein J6590_066355 [Homalodisca vitripennis]